MPFIELGTRRMQYVEQGAGAPVILVHSGGMTSRQWGRITASLATDYRVVAPDLLGYGGSSGVDESFAFAEDVAAVAALVDAVGGRAHLVGHSYGGLVVLSVARARPAVALSVAAYEPVAFGVLHALGDAAGIADLARVEASLADDATGGGEAWLERFVDFWNEPGAWKSLPAPTRGAFLSVGRKVYLEVRSLMADRTTPEAWAVIDAPTLFLTGARSPVAARRVVEILASALPNAQLTRIEDAGHMGPITHADRVGTLLRAHFRFSSSG